MYPQIIHVFSGNLPRWEKPVAFHGGTLQLGRARVNHGLPVAQDAEVLKKLRNLIIVDIYVYYLNMNVDLHIN